MTITDSKCYEVASATTLTGTVNALVDDFIIATITVRSALTLPVGWTLLYTSPVIGNNQTMSFAYKRATTSEVVSLNVTQATAARIYINLISIAGLTGVEHMLGLTVSNTTGSAPVFSVPNKVSNNAIIWGCSADLWSPGTWVTAPNDLIMVSLDATIAARQANFIDLGTGAVGRTFTPMADTCTYIVSAIQLIDTPIVELPTKRLGQKIAIKFNNALNNNFDEILSYEYEQVIGATVTASSQSSATYSADKTVDNNLGTYWHPTTEVAWIKFQFPLTWKLNCFRWYIPYIGSYFPTSFNIGGSNDGSNFTQLGTFEGAEVVGWQEFNFENSSTYLYYIINITNVAGAKAECVKISEIQFKTKPIFIDKAFSITGLEKEYYPDGSLVPGDYKVESVRLYTEVDTKTILLTLNTLNRFSRVLSNLTISYDATKGNLRSGYRKLPSFSLICTLIDLVPDTLKYHANSVDNINTSIETTFVVSKVVYTDAYEEENITASIIPTFVVTKVVYTDAYEEEIITASIIPTFVVTKV